MSLRPEVFGTAVDRFDPMNAIDVTSDERSQAIRSLRRKRGFRTEVVCYLLINALLWGVWAATGGAADQGWWPAWVSAAWGIGLAVSAWHTFGEKPISESAIDAELGRMNRS
jgi:hypothetical protein